MLSDSLLRCSGPKLTANKKDNKTIDASPEIYSCTGIPTCDCIVRNQRCSHLNTESLTLLTFKERKEIRTNKIAEFQPMPLHTILQTVAIFLNFYFNRNVLRNPCDIAGCGRFRSHHWTHS